MKMIQRQTVRVSNFKMVPTEDGKGRVSIRMPDTNEAFIVELDPEKLLQHYAYRVAHSKTGKSRLLHGAVQIIHIREAK